MFYYSSLISERVIYLTQKKQNLRLLLSIYIAHKIMTDLDKKTENQFDWLDFLKLSYDFWNKSAYGSSGLNPHQLIQEMRKNKEKFEMILKRTGINDYLTIFEQLL